MSDLISRQSAIDAIEAMQMPIMRSTFAEEQFVFRGMSDALDAIKELPSAEPSLQDWQKIVLSNLISERKTGKWINVSDTCNECSECGATWSYLLNEILRFRYCPNCGKRMEGTE